MSLPMAHSCTSAGSKLLQNRNMKYTKSPSIPKTCSLIIDGGVYDTCIPVESLENQSIPWRFVWAANQWKNRIDDLTHLVPKILAGPKLYTLHYTPGKLTWLAGKSPCSTGNTFSFMVDVLRMTIHFQDPMTCSQITTQISCVLFSHLFFCSPSSSSEGVGRGADSD